MQQSTTTKWLQQFGSLEGVIAQAGALQPERFREAVRAGADRLRLNLRLTTLNLALPTVAAEKITSQPETLLRLLEELEMRTASVEARQRYSGQQELF